MARPTVRERAGERICPECGGPAERKSPKGPPPTFCSLKCKKAHGNRHMVEGLAIAGLLKAWRIDRGQGEIAQRAFAEAVSVLDLFNAQDAEAGRPRADLYAAKRLSDPTRYIDRQKKKKAAATAL